MALIRRHLIQGKGLEPRLRHGKFLQVLLATVLFTSMAGINVVRVNYKGTTAALTGLLTGDTQMAFANAGSVMPYIKSGSNSRQRSKRKW